MYHTSLERYFYGASIGPWFVKIHAEKPEKMEVQTSIWFSAMFKMIVGQKVSGQKVFT